MKALFILYFLAPSSLLFAQTQIFTESPQTPPFVGVGVGSIAFADVNNDTHPDVLITGSNGASPMAILYINDGTGNFTEATGNPFVGAGASSIAFADVNGDHYPDVLITGHNSVLPPTSKLYINNGMGHFTEALGTTFEGVYFSSVAFSDVNGDTYPDVLITGNTGSGRISKLYINDGMGQFSEALGTPFDEVILGSVAFADVNGDTHPDVLITGQSIAGPISKLYTNDGLGNFSEILGTPFEGVRKSSIAFADVNGDTHPDVLITGESLSGRITKLYTNDGTGTFSEILGTPFEGISTGSVAFADVNSDNTLDVFISGWNGSGPISKLYTNDGQGNFTPLVGTPFPNVYGSSVGFSDVNSDNRPDILITGTNDTVVFSKLFINEGVVNSTNDLITEYDLDFMLYPNPSEEGKINLIYDATENSVVQVQVYDLNGHRISQQKMLVTTGKQTITIDIATLIKGSYLIEMNNGKKRGIARFIVQ